METYKIGATNELSGSISAKKMVKKTGNAIKSRAEAQLCIERVEEHVTNKMAFALRSEWWEASSVKSWRATFKAERPQGLKHWGGVSKGVKYFFNWWGYTWEDCHWLDRGEGKRNTETDSQVFLSQATGWMSVPPLRQKIDEIKASLRKRRKWYHFWIC